MQSALEAMLTLQDRMNTKVHPQWQAQHYAWYRAVWIECAELLDHLGYKWWKQQQCDMAQVRLEVVDIWHFGLSDRFDGRSITEIARDLAAEIEAHTPVSHDDPRLAVEALAEQTLVERRFALEPFLDLMASVEIDFDQLHRAYIGKNVLNFFRQDHGYKSGEYRKVWAGREDNEHLHELLEQLDTQAGDFAGHLYQALSERYAQTDTAE